ncbi:MAG: branched-chain amino acid ABC transporter permease [Rhizobiaceae bacterium]|nr:branched-chain amino acid ABC transporter permease [Rhizobiaceae bacterium]
MKADAIDTSVQGYEMSLNYGAALRSAILIIMGLLFVVGMLIPLMTSRLSFWFYLFQWIALAGGINIIAGFTGYLPFGYVAFFGVGAYSAGIVIGVLGWPAPAALLIAAVAGALVSVVLAPTLRLSGIYFALTSLALSMIIQTIVSMLPEDIAGGAGGLFVRAGVSFEIIYVCMVLIAALATAICVYIAKSRFGLMLKAIRDDPVGASATGINVPLLRLYAWMTSATIAACAGAVEAMFTSIIDTTTAFDSMITAKAIIFAGIGGLGTVVGPIVGATFMSALDNLIWLQFPTMGVLILGLAIILVVLFIPAGLVGTLLAKRPKLRRVLF